MLIPGNDLWVILSLGGQFKEGEIAMRTIEVVFYRDEKAWVAQALNVDISSFGDSRQEAQAAIKEALELYFEDAPQAEVIQVADVEVETVSVGTA